MSSAPPDAPQPAVTVPAPPVARHSRGVGIVLIFFYAILAIGATSRAVYQLIAFYSSARVPITLSAVSGLVYIVATLALFLPGRTWYRVAWITIGFELVGVLVVGSLSILDPSVFAGSAKVAFGTVWSYYGAGYVFIPLVLPVLGMLWLRSRRALYAKASDAKAGDAKAGDAKAGDANASDANASGH